jgi:phage FluMu protein Com
MSRLVVKCPKCNHTESVVSTKPGAALPPCPRCEGNDEFVRMENHTPAPNQQTVWSTGGAQAVNPVSGEPSQPSPAISPNKKDNRGYGPQPRA